MFLSVLTIFILAIPCSSALVIDASENWDGPYKVTGGRTLLVEELSATWCENCAEIDPYLMDAADAHGSRVAMVTYHPSDGFDAFQPPASQHRIDRLMITHPEIGSTPSFIVDGGKLRIGSESWPDVQKDILTKEVNNLNPSNLEFTILKNDSGIQANIGKFDNRGNGLGSSQLTFMLMQHGLEVPSGFDNPGENIRDRVVTGIAECNLQNDTITYFEGFTSSQIVGDSCSTGFEVINDDINSDFSIILLHETTYDNLSAQNMTSQTYGAVEFAYRDYEISDSWNNLILIIIGFTIVGFLWITYEKTR